MDYSGLEFEFESEFESASDTKYVKHQANAARASAFKLPIFWNQVTGSCQRNCPTLSPAQGQPPVGIQSQPQAARKPQDGVQIQPRIVARAQSKVIQPPNVARKQSEQSQPQDGVLSQVQPQNQPLNDEKRQPLVLKSQPPSWGDQPSGSQPPFAGQSETPKQPPSKSESRPQKQPPERPPDDQRPVIEKRQPLSSGVKSLRQPLKIAQSQVAGPKRKQPPAAKRQPPNAGIKSQFQPLRTGILSRPKQPRNVARVQPPRTVPDLPPDPDPAPGNKKKAKMSTAAAMGKHVLPPMGQGYP